MGPAIAERLVIFSFEPGAFSNIATFAVKSQFSPGVARVIRASRLHCVDREHDVPPRRKNPSIRCSRSHSVRLLRGPHHHGLKEDNVGTAKSHAGRCWSHDVSVESIFNIIIYFAEEVSVKS